MSVPLLRPGDTVALVACSDGLTSRDRREVDALVAVLEGYGLLVAPSPHLWAPDHSTDLLPAPDAVRAAHLAACLAEEDVRCVFDVSGGDLAGGVLTHLDVAAAAASGTPFVGYSDVTLLANALVGAGGRGIVWSARTLVRSDAAAQRRRFEESFLGSGRSLFVTGAEPLEGAASGPLAGGNLRCLLKLAGTPHWPDLTGAVLALESLGATPQGLRAGLHQLRQLGAFERVAGVLLGTFTRCEDTFGRPTVERIAAEVVPAGVPLARAGFGHGAGSLALDLGARVAW